MNNRKDCLSALIGSLELWGGIGQVGSSGWEHLQVIDRIDRFGDYSNPGHLYHIIETERVCNLKIFLSVMHVSGEALFNPSIMETYVHVLVHNNINSLWSKSSQTISPRSACAGLYSLE